MSNFTKVVEKVKLALNESPIPDGAHFNAAINEWEIIIDGDPVAWTETSQSRAWEIYNDMVRIDNRSRRSIPITANGRTTVLEWETCPNCGAILDVGENCLDCNSPSPFWRIESTAGNTATIDYQSVISYSCTYCGGDLPCQFCREF